MREHTHRQTRRGLSLFTFILCFGALLGAALLMQAGGRDKSVSASDPTPVHTETPAPTETPVPDNRVPWNMVLVNHWHPITEVYWEEPELVTLSNGKQVDARIYPYLQQMFDDMERAGIYPVVASAHRTQEEQRRIYDETMAGYLAQGLSEDAARIETEKWVSVPGTSEHQLGLGVDINADGIHSAGYEVYDWLAENAYRYGFIQRYPADKTDITGVENEPWHYRYVGAEAAAEIHRLGVCLEEYLDMQKEK